MLKINPEFRDLIPPLTPEERNNLEKNLKAYGCTDPIVVWSQGEVILDGHNRFEICERLGIPYKTIVLDDLEDEIEAKYWIFTRQFARRNLNAYQRAELATKLEPVFAELARKNKERAAIESNKNRTADVKNPELPILATPEIKKINVREAVAKISNVSSGTMEKINVIKKEATEEIKAALRDGKTTINKEYKKIKAEKKAKKEDKEPSPEELLKEQNKQVNKISHKIALLQSDIAHCKTAFGLSPENKAALADDFSDILALLRD